MNTKKDEFMLTMSDLLNRRAIIGGSDLPIIMGLSSYKTPYQLYLEKKGLIEPSLEMTPNQYWGSKLESVVRDEFAMRNDIEVTTPAPKFHPLFTFIRGSVDGFIPDWNAVLEIKCSAQFMAKDWGPSGSDIIPMSYLVQVATYCNITEADKAHIAVLIGGCDYREFIYNRDDELESVVIDAALSFWDCLQNDEPPAISSMVDARLKYNALPDSNVTANDYIIQSLSNLYDIKRKQKELIDIEESYKLKIVEYMKNSESLLNAEGRPLVTHKSNKRGSRVFLLKGEKDE